MALDDDPKWPKAFYALTPGRQKGYLRIRRSKAIGDSCRRVEKHVPRILKGPDSMIKASAAKAIYK